MRMIEIDGSEKSGSGTILRYGLMLSCILNKDLHIYNIRAKRKKAGLQPQHLKTVEAFKFLTGATVEGAYLNSKEIIFCPGRNRIKSGEFTWDIGTAGSTTMMGLALLPLGFLASNPSVYRISGGLFQDFAPNAFHTKYVLMELLKGFSLHADLKMVKPGYVPTGGGSIEIKVKPLGREITPLKLTEQGKITKIEGVSLSSHLSERKVSERMAAECNNILNKRGLNTDIKIINDKTANQKGAALAIWALTDTGCILGSDMAGKVGRTSEEIGKSVARNLLEDLDSGATVDRFMADQIIIYAALANGESQYIFPRFTEHIESNLWLIKDILGAESSIDKNFLKIKGIGVGIDFFKLAKQ
jgi:RNA 3'-terminal phosphate cyclase (ATP)